MNPAAVWVTRPAPGNAVTSGVLRDAGYRVLDIPVLEVILEAAEPWPGETWPDWILFVSANAVAGLEAAGRQRGFPAGDRSRVRVAAVGTRTAEAAARAGWPGALVPEEENAVGLLEALPADGWEGRTVWIPAGNREGSARDDLPAALESRGARVAVLPVYRTEARALGAEEIARLEASAPGAAVVHSPSAAQAVLGPEAPAALEPWWAAAFVAIGARTGQACRRLGAARVHVAAAPSDRGILDVLASLPDLVREKERR